MDLKRLKLDRRYWSVFVVRPIGRFAPKTLRDRPRRMAATKRYYGPALKADALEWADRYNARAQRRGWGTWAVAHGNAANARLRLQEARIEQLFEASPVTVALSRSFRQRGRTVAIQVRHSIAVEHPPTPEDVLECLRAKLRDMEACLQPKARRSA